jgi:hypothetical protein
MVAKSIDRILQGFHEPVMSAREYFDEAILSLSGALLTREIMALSRLMSLPEPPMDGEIADCFHDVVPSAEVWDGIKETYKDVIEETDDSKALERLVQMSEVCRLSF